MTTIPLSAHVETAQRHLGEPAPTNSCVRLGPRRWAAELGLPVIDSDSVTEWERQARAGVDGWRYVEGTDGIRPGHYADWRSDQLGGDGTNRHVCVVETVEGGRWRGIGAGTPSGLVARQPASGGTNVLAVLRGYFVAPSAPPKAAQAPSKPKPKPSKAPQTATVDTAGVYRVRKGDTVDGLAGRWHTTRAAILKANPAGSSRRGEDFRIVNANLIYIGQRLHRP